MTELWIRERAEHCLAQALRERDLVSRVLDALPLKDGLTDVRPLTLAADVLVEFGPDVELSELVKALPPEPAYDLPGRKMQLPAGRLRQEPNYVAWEIFPVTLVNDSLRRRRVARWWTRLDDLLTQVEKDGADLVDLHVLMGYQAWQYEQVVTDKHDGRIVLQRRTLAPPRLKPSLFAQWWLGWEDWLCEKRLCSQLQAPRYTAAVRALRHLTVTAAKDWPRRSFETMLQDRIGLREMLAEIAPPHRDELLQFARSQWASAASAAASIADAKACVIDKLESLLWQQGSIINVSDRDAALRRLSWWLMDETGVELAVRGLTYADGAATAFLWMRDVERINGGIGEVRLNFSNVRGGELRPGDLPVRYVGS